MPGSLSHLILFISYNGRLAPSVWNSSSSDIADWPWNWWSCHIYLASPSKSANIRFYFWYTFPCIHRLSPKEKICSFVFHSFCRFHMSDPIPFPAIRFHVFEGRRRKCYSSGQSRCWRTPSTWKWRAEQAPSSDKRTSIFRDPWDSHQARLCHWCRPAALDHRIWPYSFPLFSRVPHILNTLSYLWSKSRPAISNWTSQRMTLSASSWTAASSTSPLPIFQMFL